MKASANSSGAQVRVRINTGGEVGHYSLTRRPLREPLTFFGLPASRSLADQMICTLPIRYGCSADLPIDSNESLPVTEYTNRFAA
jgi:hypothetical protein